MADGKVNALGTEFMKQALYTNVTQMGVTGRTGAANLVSGGQLGTGLRLQDIDAATPLVFNPTVFVVTHLPSMWKPYPRLMEMLKSIIETHAKTITGVDVNYTLTTDQTVVGHDGQNQQVPLRSSRGEVTPTMTFQEVSGNLIWNIFRTWIFDIQHPDTNFSRLSAQVGKKEMYPWLMSTYSMSMIGIQYDPTGYAENIIDGAFYTNMFPTTTGEFGFQRQINTTEIKERSITFTGMVQHNENTREAAYQIAKMLNLHKINYDFSLPGLTGVTLPENGSITKTISKLGLYDEALGVEMPAVSSFKPLGQDPYTDRFYKMEDRFRPDADSTRPGGDPTGFKDRQPHPALNHVPHS